MRTIAFMNQKGGVGKTTCVANLGAAFARRGQRVLLVDIDPQANLSLHFDIDIHHLEESLYTVLVSDTRAEDAIVSEVLPGISILPSNIDLSGAEIELVNAVGRETLLRTALQPYLEVESFDFVLFDCPPSLGLLSLNALTSAREVFIPLQTQFFALQGMTRLIDVIDLIRNRLGHHVEITGILPTLYDTRTRLSQEVVQEIREFFDDKVFDTVINANVRLAESPSHGKTIFDYAPDSRGAQDYEALATEILARGLKEGGVRPITASESTPPRF